MKNDNGENHLSDEELQREFGIAAHGWRERSEAFTEAFEVCSRPSFGEPKHLRVTTTTGHVFTPEGRHFVRKWFREQSPEDQQLLVKIEKLWPEIGQWEIVYHNGEWV